MLVYCYIFQYFQLTDPQGSLDDARHPPFVARGEPIRSRHARRTGRRARDRMEATAADGVGDTKATASASERVAAEDSRESPSCETNVNASELEESAPTSNAFATSNAYDLGNAYSDANETTPKTQQNTAKRRASAAACAVKMAEEKKRRERMGTMLDSDVDFSSFPITLPSEVRGASTDGGRAPAAAHCRGCRRSLPMDLHFDTDKKTCRQCLSRQRLKWRKTAHKPTDT